MLSKSVSKIQKDSLLVLCATTCLPLRENIMSLTLETPSPRLLPGT